MAADAEMWFPLRILRAAGTVLLVGVIDEIVSEHFTVHRANLAIAKVFPQPLRAAVAAHCHPTGVHDGPAFFFLMTNDGGQD